MTVSHLSYNCNSVAETPDRAAHLVRQHAQWAANQTGADRDRVLASTCRANQQLGSPSTLKEIKGLVRKVWKEPRNRTIEHFRDPAEYERVRRTVAAARKALDTTPWPEAFAKNCRRAASLIIDIAHRTGKTAVALSERDLADRMGVTAKYANHYLRALSGTYRRDTVPTLLSCKNLRTTSPTRANVYTLRPLHAWRIPSLSGRSYVSEVISAQKVGEKSAQNARKRTSRERVLGAVSRVPCGSAKDLASAAGVSQKVAELHLTALRKNALVKKVDGVYQLTTPPPRHTAMPDFGHDAFRHRGLGKTAAEVLAVIEQGQIRTAHDLAAVAPDMTFDRARRALTALKKAGLIEKFSGVYRRLDKSLETAAYEHGTLGVGKKQRDQHAHERTRFQTAVESGELQPGFGKRKLHIIPAAVPEPMWDGLDATNEQPMRHAA